MSLHSRVRELEDRIVEIERANIDRALMLTKALQALAKVDASIISKLEDFHAMHKEQTAILSLITVRLRNGASLASAEPSPDPAAVAQPSDNTDRDEPDVRCNVPPG